MERPLATSFVRLRNFGRRVVGTFGGDRPEKRTPEVLRRERTFRALSNWNNLKRLVLENEFLADIPSLQTNSPVEICSNYVFHQSLNGRGNFAAIAVDPQGQAALFVSIPRGYRGDITWLRQENPDEVIWEWLKYGENWNLLEKFAKMTRKEIGSKLLEGKPLPE